VQAKFDDDGSVSVSWSSVNDAAGYVISRASAKNGKYEKVTEVGAVTQWTDREAQAGGEYWYTVTAFNKAGDAIPSEPAKAEIPEGSELLLPLTVHVEETSPTSVLISWDAVEGAKGYIVCRALSENGEYLDLCDTTDLFWNDTDLAEGSSCFYIVSAYLENGLDIAVSEVMSLTLTMPVTSAATATEPDVGGSAFSNSMRTLREKVSQPAVVISLFAAAGSVIALIVLLVIGKRRKKQKGRASARRLPAAPRPDGYATGAITGAIPKVSTGTKNKRTQKKKRKRGVPAASASSVLAPADSPHETEMSASMELTGILDALKAAEANEAV